MVVAQKIMRNKDLLSLELCVGVCLENFIYLTVTSFLS